MGRYDTHDHPLVDLGTKDKKYLFPGKDYANPYVKDFINVSDFEECQFDRKIQHRMPWHDLQVSIRGDAVHDL